MRGASDCIARESSYRLMERWYLYAIALTAGTICLNLAVLPKMTELIEGIFLRSLWFPVEDSQMDGILDSARHGLVVYSIASGLKMGALILFSAASARAVLVLGGHDVCLRTCAAAGVILVSVLFAKELLGVLCIALAPSESATMDSLRFRAGPSLFLDTVGWGPALNYLTEKADLFGMGSVLLSSAWLRGKMDVRWPSALGAMLVPSLAALLVGLAIHLALSGKLDHIGAGSW